MRRLLILALIAALASPMVACGRKGTPNLPEGEQDDFPRRYPNRDYLPPPELPPTVPRQ